MYSASRRRAPARRGRTRRQPMRRQETGNPAHDPAKHRRRVPKIRTYTHIQYTHIRVHTHLRCYLAIVQQLTYAQVCSRSVPQKSGSRVWRTFTHSARKARGLKLSSQAQMLQNHQRNEEPQDGKEDVWIQSGSCQFLSNIKFISPGRDLRHSDSVILIRGAFCKENRSRPPSRRAPARRRRGSRAPPRHGPRPSLCKLSFAKMATHGFNQ